jgi:hypothetical protein
VQQQQQQQQQQSIIKWCLLISIISGDGRKQQNSSRALNLWQDLDTKANYYYTQVSAQQNPNSVHLLLQQQLDKLAENTLNLEASSSSSTIITSSPPNSTPKMFFGVQFCDESKG